MSGKIKFRKEDGRGEIENTLGRGYYHTRTIFMERNPFLGTYKVNKYPLLLISLVPLIFDHPFIPMLLVGLVLATINAYGHYHKSKATLWGAITAGFSLYVENIAALYFLISILYLIYNVFKSPLYPLAFLVLDYALPKIFMRIWRWLR